MDGKQTTPYQRILKLSVMQQSVKMMMMTMQFSAALMLLPSRRLFIFWKFAIEEPYQLLYLGNVVIIVRIKLVILLA